jgi:hypothetical protein
MKREGDKDTIRPQGVKRGSKVYNFEINAFNDATPHHCVQNGSGAHPASYSMGTRGCFPGDKAAGA